MGGGKGKKTLMQSEQLGFKNEKKNPETDQLRIKSTASFAKSH